MTDSIQQVKEAEIQKLLAELESIKEKLKKNQSWLDCVSLFGKTAAILGQIRAIRSKTVSTKNNHDLKVAPHSMLIDLDTFIADSDGCALVIQVPTGVKYTAQCGGMSCTHPNAEGVYLPMWDIAPDIDDCKEGCSDLTKSPKFDRPDLRMALADLIQAALNKPTNFGFQLCFDYSRIDDLKEGWWPLRIKGKIHGIEGLDHACIYHRSNCD